MWCKDEERTSKRTKKERDRWENRNTQKEPNDRAANKDGIQDIGI